MSLEIGSLANWVSVLLSLVAMLFAGLAWWQRSDRENAREMQSLHDELEGLIDEKARRAHQRIDDLKGEEAQLRDRVSRIERAQQDAPTGKAVHELALSITHFGGELKALTSQLQGMEKMVDRQERVVGRLEDWMRKVERQ